MIAELRQEARGGGADQKANPESYADEAERARAVFRFRNVGNIRLRQREISRSDAIDDARKVDDPERRRGSQNQETNKRAKLAHDQERFAAAHTIGPASEKWSGDQLTKRVG